MQEKHDDEDAAEGYDDGGAGGGVELDAQIHAQRGDESAHGPANGQARTDAVRKEHGANARHDQVAENQQNASDSHRRSNDKSERGIKKKIPEAHVEPGLFGPVMIHGDEQEFLAEDEVKEADGAVEQRGLD